MRRNRAAACLIAACMVLMAATAMAQGPAPGGGPGGPRGRRGPGGPGGPGGRRGGPPENAFQAMEAARVYLLVQELELNDEQCVEIIPILLDAGKQRRVAYQKRQAAITDLKRMIEDDNLMEAELKAKMEQLQVIMEETRAAEEQLAKTMEEHLTVRQQAQLILFHQEFESRVRELVGRFRDGDGDGPPPEVRERLRQMREHGDGPGGPGGRRGRGPRPDGPPPGEAP